MSSSTTLPTDVLPVNGNLLEDNTVDDINFTVTNTAYEVRTLSNLAQSGDNSDLRVFYSSDTNNIRFTAINNKYLSARFNLRRYNIIFLFLNNSNPNSLFTNNRSVFIKNIASEFLRIENSNGEIYLFLDNILITDTPFIYDSIIPLLNDNSGDIFFPLIYDTFTFTSNAPWKIVEILNNPGQKNYFIEENNGDKVFSLSNLTVGQSFSITISNTSLLYFELRVRWSIETTDNLLISYEENSFSRNGGHQNFFNGETFLASINDGNDVVITFTKNESGNNLNEIYFYLVNITDIPHPPPPSPPLPFSITENFVYENINYSPSGTNNNWIQKYLNDISGNRFVDDDNLSNETVVFSCENLANNQNSQLTLTPFSNTYFSANLNLRWNTEFGFDFLIVQRNNQIINYYTGGNNVYLGTTIFIDNISNVDSISVQYIKDFVTSSTLNTVYIYLTDITFSFNIENPPFITSQITQNDIIYNPINLFRWNSRQIGQARFPSDDPDQQVFFCDGFFTGIDGSNSSGLEIYPLDNKYLSGKLYFRRSNRNITFQSFEIKIGDDFSQTFNGNNTSNYLGYLINLSNINNNNNKLIINYNKTNTASSNSSSSGRDNCYFYFDNIEITDIPQEDSRITTSITIDDIVYNPESNIKKWFTRTLNDLVDTIFEDDKNVDGNTTIFSCEWLENNENNENSYLVITPENSQPFSKVLNIRYSSEILDHLNIYQGNLDNRINYYAGNLSSGYLGTSVIIENISSDNSLIIEYHKNTSIALGYNKVYFYFTDIITDLIKESGIVNETLNYSPESLQRWRYQEIGAIKSENDNENQEVFICDGFFNNNQFSAMKFSHNEEGFLFLELKLRRCIRNNTNHRIEILVNNSVIETINSNSDIYSLSFDETTHNINNISKTDNFTIRYFKNTNIVSSNRDSVYFYFDNISYSTNPILPFLITSPIIVDDITYQPGGFSDNWNQRENNGRIEFSCENLANNFKSFLRLSSITPKSFKLHLFWGTEINYDFLNLYQEGIKVARFSGHDSNNYLSQVLFIKNLHLYPLTIEYSKDGIVLIQPDNVYFYITDIIDGLLSTKINRNLLNNQNITEPTNWNNLSLNPTSDLKNWRITSLDENKLITDHLGQEVIMCSLSVNSSCTLEVTKLEPFDQENDIILNLRYSLFSTSSFIVNKGDNQIFNIISTNTRSPNPGYSGQSIPIEFNDNDVYTFTYNKNNNDPETFNTVYFFFSSSSLISTPSLKITAKLCSNCP